MRRGTMQGRLIGLAIAAVARRRRPRRARRGGGADVHERGGDLRHRDGRRRLDVQGGGAAALERHAAALQPRLPAADRPEPAGRHLGQPPGRRRAARARLRARGLVLRHRTAGRWRARSATRSTCSIASSGASAKPRRTIAWGESMGGMITAGLVERHPRRFDGALPFCGILGGAVGAVEPEPRPASTRSRRCCRPTRIRPSRSRRRSSSSCTSRTGRRTSRAPTRRSPPRRRRRRAARGSRSPPPCSTCPTGTSPAPRARPATTTRSGSGRSSSRCSSSSRSSSASARTSSSAPAATRRGTPASTTAGCSRAPAAATWSARSTGRAGLDLRADLRRLARAPRVRAERARHRAT